MIALNFVEFSVSVLLNILTLKWKVLFSNVNARLFYSLDQLEYSEIQLRKYTLNMPQTTAYQDIAVGI